jgi:hypothetical protein
VQKPSPAQPGGAHAPPRPTPQLAPQRASCWPPLRQGALARRLADRPTNAQGGPAPCRRRRRHARAPLPRTTRAPGPHLHPLGPAAVVARQQEAGLAADRARHAPAVALDQVLCLVAVQRVQHAADHDRLAWGRCVCGGGEGGGGRRGWSGAGFGVFFGGCRRRRAALAGSESALLLAGLPGTRRGKRQAGPAAGACGGLAGKAGGRAGTCEAVGVAARHVPLPQVGRRRVVVAARDLDRCSRAATWWVPAARGSSSGRAGGCRGQRPGRGPGPGPGQGAQRCCCAERGGHRRARARRVARQQHAPSWRLIRPTSTAALPVLRAQSPPPHPVPPNTRPRPHGPQAPHLQG